MYVNKHFHLDFSFGIMSEPMKYCEATYRRLGDEDEVLIKQLKLHKSSATSDLFKRSITCEKYENRLREIKSFQTSVQSRGSKTAEESLFYHFTFNNEEYQFKHGDMKEMAEAAQMANPTTVRFNSDGSTVEFFEWKRDTAPQLDVVLDTYFNKFYTGHFMTHQGKLSFFIEGEEYYWIGYNGVQCCVDECKAVAFFALVNKQLKFMIVGHSPEKTHIHDTKPGPDNGTKWVAKERDVWKRLPRDEVALFLRNDNFSAEDMTMDRFTKQAVFHPEYNAWLIDMNEKGLGYSFKKHRTLNNGIVKYQCAARYRIKCNVFAYTRKLNGKQMAVHSPQEDHQCGPPISIEAMVVQSEERSKLKKNRKPYLMK